MDTTRTHYGPADDHGDGDTSRERTGSPVTPEMRISFDCPACGGRIETDASPSSVEFPCPHCGSLIMTPAIGFGAGMLLDDFKLIRRIGQGAMGEVYLALQQSLSRHVAVKILAPGMTSSPEQIERFHREVQNLARLHHPHIVSAFYAGVRDDIHYLAMTYVDGRNLHTHIRETGSLPEEEALSVIYKVADALRYAWEEFGFIHRDIKPANIMIDQDGEVKLTDLGLSKFVYEESSATHGHRIFGTPHYMSPEQARGDLDLDFRSDMYSLGASFYHMLAGHPPFDGEDAHTVLERQRTDAPPPIHDMCPSLSEGSASILQRLLAKSPNERYDSWDDLLRAVTESLAQLPEHDESPKWRDRSQGAGRGKAGRRRKRTRFLTALALFIAALLGWAAWEYKGSAPEDPSLPDFAQQALERARTSPEHLDAAIEKLREQVGRAAGATEEAYLRWSKLRLERERQQRIAEVLEHLDERARAYLHAGLPDYAAEVYLEYDGPWAEESLEARLERAAAYERHRP